MNTDGNQTSYRRRQSASICGWKYSPFKLPWRIFGPFTSSITLGVGSGVPVTATSGALLLPEVYLRLCRWGRKLKEAGFSESGESGSGALVPRPHDERGAKGMKKITLQAGSLLVTLVLVAGFAFAQSAQKVSVPFKFTAGEAALCLPEPTISLTRLPRRAWRCAMRARRLSA